ncbi:hypothetical protein [Deinococcus sp. S9]|uniref:hypothetical protein n=1 Tax=Deinococcus sp. S9 TaxID=2545754 RepID=UPI001054C902|nr:hypothetical protein [Deinococcus sp. S9]TDE87388.1 hypothetical protein E0686_02530 [Deinococcus sp. S9]
MTHKEDSPMLLQPTPATMPSGAPPETEAQRLTAEIMLTRERLHDLQRQLNAEERHLKRLERQLAAAC